MSVDGSELIEKFRDRGVWRGNGLYLRSSDAREFIEEASALMVRIIGIECFEEEANKLRPRLDLIADFSDVSLKAANDDARSFIKSVPAEVLCSFTLDE